MNTLSPRWQFVQFSESVYPSPIEPMCSGQSDGVSRRELSRAMLSQKHAFPLLWFWQIMPMNHDGPAGSSRGSAKQIPLASGGV